MARSTPQMCVRSHMQRDTETRSDIYRMMLFTDHRPSIGIYPGLLRMIDPDQLACPVYPSTNTACKAVKFILFFSASHFFFTFDLGVDVDFCFR